MWEREVDKEKNKNGGQGDHRPIAQGRKQERKKKGSEKVTGPSGTDV